MKKSMDALRSAHELFRVLLRHVTFRLMFDSLMKRSWHLIDMYLFVIGIHLSHRSCHYSNHFYRDCYLLYKFHKIPLVLLVKRALQLAISSILVQHVHLDWHPGMWIMCKFSNAHKHPIQDHKEHREYPLQK